MIRLNTPLIIFSIVFCTLLNACSARKTGTLAEENLYALQAESGFGYINQKGEWIIAPQYINAQHFSEALGAAREGGYYGCINAKNEWVIPAEFDYIYPFKSGIAIAYKKGKPYYIDKTGSILFEHDFAELRGFENGLARVVALSGKQGFINRNGELIIDTIFSSFYERYGFIQGMINEFTEEKGYQNLGTALFDINGKVVLPRGQYEYIDILGDGYVLVNDSLVLDSGGNRLLKSLEENILVSNYLLDDLFVASIYKEGLTSKEKSRSVPTFCIVNLKGEILKTDTNWSHFNQPVEGVIPISLNNGTTQFLNTELKPIYNFEINDYLKPGMKDGKMWVEINGLWGLIDKSGQLLKEPYLESVYLLDQREHILTYAEESVLDGEITEYGIMSFEGNSFDKQLDERVGYGQFANGLVVVNGKTPYLLNREGEILPNELYTERNAEQCLNIDYMDIANFSASSKPHPSDLGGFGKGRNSPQEIPENLQDVSNELQIIVGPNEQQEQSGYFERSVYLINNSESDSEFLASDGAISVVLEAKDENGVWRPITYRLSSWCGNSYHTLTLEKGKLWSFKTPVYQGAIETQMRIKLTDFASSAEPSDIQTEDKLTGLPIVSIQNTNVLYSDTFKGEVNPAQFWRKEAYEPSGLMDPWYN